MNNLKVAFLIALLYICCSASERTLDMFKWNGITITFFIIPTIIGLIIYWTVDLNYKDTYEKGREDGIRNIQYQVRTITKQELRDALSYHEVQFEHKKREPIQIPIPNKN